MSKFRFLIRKGESETFTPWEDEAIRSGVGQHSAVARISQLRAQHGPFAAISIERAGHDTTPNPIALYRYKIKVKDDIYYSKILRENEKEAARAQIEEQFPKTEITLERFNG